MKRRDFVRISAFISAAVSVPLLHSCNTSTVDKAMSQPLFLSRLFNEAQLNEAGKEYIRKRPEENDKKTLVQLLSGNGSIAKSSDTVQIHRFLDQQVRQDFEKGDTIVVKGWVLSVTEARQCALFSLIQT